MSAPLLFLLSLRGLDESELADVAEILAELLELYEAEVQA